MTNFSRWEEGHDDVKASMFRIGKGSRRAPHLLPRPAANETTRDCQPLILSFLLSFLRNTHTHLFKLSSYTTNTANMVAQTAEFKKAVEDSRKLKAKPSDDELLQVR